MKFKFLMSELSLSLIGTSLTFGHQFIANRSLEIWRLAIQEFNHDQQERNGIEKEFRILGGG